MGGKEARGGYVPNALFALFMQVGQTELHKSAGKVIQPLTQLQRRWQRHGCPRIHRKPQHNVRVLVGYVDVPVAIVAYSVAVVQTRVVFPFRDDFHKVALVRFGWVFLRVNALTEDEQSVVTREYRRTEMSRAKAG